MLLNSSSFRVTTRTYRGVQYVVFSFYKDKELLIDHIGGLIKTAFETSETPVITSENLSEISENVCELDSYWDADVV